MFAVRAIKSIDFTYLYPLCAVVKVYYFRKLFAMVVELKTKILESERPLFNDILYTIFYCTHVNLFLKRKFVSREIRDRISSMRKKNEKKRKTWSFHKCLHQTLEADMGLKNENSLVKYLSNDAIDLS